ncbi:MAG: hypothetical protein M3P18_22975 [Actinomycetota bacterium]|nr:hypothetical protein [Actinomycetota bacterium]
MYRQSGVMSAGAAVALGLIGATSLVLYTVLAQNLAPPTTTARPLVIGASKPAPTEPAGVKVAASSGGGGRHHVAPSVLTWLQRPLRAPVSVALFQPPGSSVTVALLSPPSAPPRGSTGGGTPPPPVPSPAGTPPPIPALTVTTAPANHCGRSKGHRIHLPQGRGRGMDPYRGKGHVLHPCKSQGRGTPPPDTHGHGPHPSNGHGTRGPADHVRHSGSGRHKAQGNQRAGRKGNGAGGGDSPQRTSTTRGQVHAHKKPAARRSQQGDSGHGQAGNATEGASGRGHTGAAAAGSTQLAQDLEATVAQPRVSPAQAADHVPAIAISVPATALEKKPSGAATI